MPPKLTITDARRPTAPGAMAGVPLVTLAWRTMRQQAQAAARAQAARSEQAAGERRAVIAIADEVHRLRCEATVNATAGAPSADSLSRRLLTLAESLERALADMGVSVVSPAGQIYSADFMELLENCAQVPDGEAREPRVAEVIAPAVVQRGMVLRMGTAVIAVPATQGQATESAAGQSSGE